MGTQCSLVLRENVLVSKVSIWTSKSFSFSFGIASPNSQMLIECTSKTDPSKTRNSHSRYFLFMTELNWKIEKECYCISWHKGLSFNSVSFCQKQIHSRKVPVKKKLWCSMYNQLVWRHTASVVTKTLAVTGWLIILLHFKGCRSVQLSLQWDVPHIIVTT